MKRPTTPLQAAALIAAAALLSGLGAAEVATPRRMPVLNVDNTPVARSGVVTSYADVLEPVQRTVVTIESIKKAIPLPPSLRSGRGTVPQAAEDEKSVGSGVIVSTDGYILTNNHVVAEADELRVITADKRTLAARLIGADPRTDIAVIKVENGEFPAITLADSDQLRVGDLVFAIGNPLDVGQSVTMGIVSAKGRNVGILDDVGGYEDFIQTDAAINLGNSGGALVDAKGRLIGINSAILSTASRREMGGNIGIGFAVPVNFASRVMRSLIETGTVARGFLGIHPAELEEGVAESFGLPKDTRGLAVTEVVKDSPAEKAGLRTNDVVTSIDGRSVTTYNELKNVVSQLFPGSVAKVDYFRDGKPVTVEVTIALAELDESDPTGLLEGVTVGVLNADLRRLWNKDASLEGLIVTEIDAKSPHYQTLERGTVILEINGQKVADIAAARRLLGQGRHRLLIQNARSATPRFVLVEVK